MMASTSRCLQSVIERAILKSLDIRPYESLDPHAISPPRQNEVVLDFPEGTGEFEFPRTSRVVDLPEFSQ